MVDNDGFHCRVHLNLLTQTSSVVVDVDLQQQQQQQSTSSVSYYHRDCTLPTVTTFTHRVARATFLYVVKEEGVHDISVRSINIDDLPTDRPHSHFGEFQMAITLQQVIRSTSRMYTAIIYVLRPWTL